MSYMPLSIEIFQILYVQCRIEHDYISRNTIDITLRNHLHLFVRDSCDSKIFYLISSTEFAAGMISYHGINISQSSIFDSLANISCAM